MKKGYVLSFKATCHGMVEGFKDVKDITIKGPERLWADDFIAKIKARELGAPENVEVLQFNIYKPEDFKEIATRSTWQFPNARIEVRESENKKAKPVVSLYGEDGMPICTVRARQKAYSSLCDIAENYKSYYIRAQRCKKDIMLPDENEDTYYHIELMYW